MSLYFDFSLVCDLRTDLPASALDALGYLAGLLPEFPESTGLDAEVLESLHHDDGEPRAAGEFGCVLRSVSRPAAPTHWTFSLRRFLHDDSFYAVWWPFALWLAPLSISNGLVGYYREEFSFQPTLLYFQAGQLYLHEVTGVPVGASEETPPFAIVTA